MSNVIEFLEKMGREAQLRHASAAELATALNQQAVDPELHAAILAGDQRRLEAVLGARTNVICGMAPAEEEAPSKDKEKEEEEIRFAAVLGGDKDEEEIRLAAARGGDKDEEEIRLAAASGGDKDEEEIRFAAPAGRVAAA